MHDRFARLHPFAHVTIDLADLPIQRRKQQAVFEDRLRGRHLGLFDLHLLYGDLGIGQGFFDGKLHLLAFEFQFFDIHGGNRALDSAVGFVADIQFRLGDKQGGFGVSFRHLVIRLFFRGLPLRLGDGKLLAAMGALLGWKALPPIVFSASFIGILVSIPVLLVQRRKRATTSAEPVAGEPAPASSSESDSLPAITDQPSPPATSIRRSEVPFGPFLAASALGYLFLHQQVWSFIERTVLGG